MRDKLKINLSTFARGIAALDSTTGQLRGLVAFDEWTPNSCHIHIDMEFPIRGLLLPAFQYPFITLGLGVILGTTPGFHSRALRLAKALGFRRTHETADGWAPGIPLVHWEMRRNECRWLDRRAPLSADSLPSTNARRQHGSESLLDEESRT